MMSMIVFFMQSFSPHFFDEIWNFLSQSESYLPALENYKLQIYV